MNRSLVRTGVAAGLVVTLAASASCRRAEPGVELFQTVDSCAGCHNGLRAPSGEDVSIPREWTATMMANSSHDPYWQASVRREMADHPDAQGAIEDECSMCHMPMTTFAARASGGRGAVFVHLAPGAGGTADRLADEGVSCTVCHQIERDRFGTPESFSGGFAIETRPISPRHAYGRFAIDAGRTRIMSTASGFAPAEAPQIREAELCATCHTLFTGSAHPSARGEPEHRSLRAGSHGVLPEQVPYLEWLASDFRNRRSCQSCHMPEIGGPTPISSVVSVPRPGFLRHSFVGGNFFVPRLLSANRTAGGVTATDGALAAHADETVAYLQRNAARLSVEDARLDNGGALRDPASLRLAPARSGHAAGLRRAVFTVRLDVLAGHKLPTAYPSRRAWLHVTVRDHGGRTLFESGAIQADGAIAGNDSDADAARFEPHYPEITRPDQVQIYESIMIDERGSVTTGLLNAVGYVKDNRLLPDGFDKAAAVKDVGVRGEAMQDPDFAGGGDRVRYVAPIADGARPPFVVDVELWYQPIGFRWAQNLRGYRAAEATRFVSSYEAQASRSAIVLTRASVTIGVR